MKRPDELHLTDPMCAVSCAENSPAAEERCLPSSARSVNVSAPGRFCWQRPSSCWQPWRPTPIVSSARSIFDDECSILENPTIRQLWPIWKPLCPPNHGETVSGRPLLNLSLAVNYAIERMQRLGLPRGEPGHSRLGGVAAVRHPAADVPAADDARRMGRGGPSAGLGRSPCFGRSIRCKPSRSRTSSSGPNRWWGCSICSRSTASSAAQTLRPAPSGGTPRSALACLLGMASKEVMVSAPLIVLLYDRTFLAGSFREAWRRRCGLYLALAGTWLLLGWLVISTGNRGGIGRLCRARVHLVVLSADAAGRDRPLPAAVAVARGVVPGLRLAGGADRRRSPAAGTLVIGSAGTDRLGADQAAGLGVPRRLVLRHPCPHVELYPHPRRGLRAPHVSAVGGHRGRRRDRHIPRRPAAGSPRDDFAAGGAGRGRLPGADGRAGAR